MKAIEDSFYFIMQNPLNLKELKNVLDKTTRVLESI
jgi:hypothetical protein